MCFFVLFFFSSIEHIRILSIGLELQSVAKVVKTLMSEWTSKPFTRQKLSITVKIPLKASKCKSPLPPINVEIDKEMCVHCWQHCSGEGEGGSCSKSVRKPTSKGECPNTFATDCSLQWRLMRGNILKSICI